MDIVLVGNNSLKLKGKQVTFIVNPNPKLPKTAADAVIVLDDNADTDVTRVTNCRIVINGPGGYEISGAKISGTKTPNGVIYRLSIDNINIVLGSEADGRMEGFNACQVAVINTNSGFDESFVTALEPKITILYGNKKLEAARALGAEHIASVPKITIAKDKLPEKMEIVALG